MIEVSNLIKYYDSFCALSSCSFGVDKGEILAFVGPNGAGKTTTIKILATVLEPSDGEAIIDGLSIINHSDKIKKLIGYMPDEYGIYPYVTVKDYLDYFAGMYDVEISRRSSVVGMVSELTGVTSFLDKETHQLSKGMVQRLALAKILLNDPKVLILDEPAHGLDPRGRIEFRLILKELRNLGKTILISSHILTELSEISDSVVIIDKGKVVTAGKVSDIQRKLQPSRKYQIKLTADTLNCIDSIRSMEHVEMVSIENDVVFIEHKQADGFIADIVGKICLNGGRILEVKEVKQNLESVFMQLTGDINESF
ncbi:MAG: ABC transporter ATP-binding protein [Planctomycetes bacterium]|nr:ABC transporter ATP-binding protein [Planctomycetota bacterium]